MSELSLQEYNFRLDHDSPKEAEDVLLKYLKPCIVYSFKEISKNYDEYVQRTMYEYQMEVMRYANT